MQSLIVGSVGGMYGSEQAHLQRVGRAQRTAWRSRLYRRHTIWRRTATDEAVRYVCFEALHESAFCVQSQDFYRLPVNRESHLQHADRAVELFIETDPFERSKSFPSLVEAIEESDADFENCWIDSNGG